MSMLNYDDNLDLLGVRFDAEVEARGRYELVQEIDKKFEEFFEEMRKEYNIRIDWSKENWDFK